MDEFMIELKREPAAKNATPVLLLTFEDIFTKSYDEAYFPRGEVGKKQNRCGNG